MATIKGTGGNDLIGPDFSYPFTLPLSTSGDDSISGLGGYDTIDGGKGNDTIDGGAGDDFFLFGNQGNDSIIGGAGNDGMYGDAGNDTLDGGDGNDTLSGNDDNDVLSGGAGNDSLEGGDGVDMLTGGSGDDRFNYLIPSDIFDGDTITDFSAGDEIWAMLHAFGADDVTISEAAGKTTLTVDTNDDGIAEGVLNFNGSLSDDLIFIRGSILPQDVFGFTIIAFGQSGTAGNDPFSGGNARDTFSGAAGDDAATGGGGDDLFDGGAGNDMLSGDAGNDRLYGDSGNDTLLGGDGNDTAAGLEGDDAIDGGAGNDAVWGGDGNDTVTGGSGDDQASGGSGNDVVDGGTGNDILLDGGLGLDTVRGGDGNDRLYSSDGNDFLDGGAGNDQLSFVGNETLRGGAGNDTFVPQLVSGIATFADFAVGDQILVFSLTKPANPQNAILGYLNEGISTLISIDSDGDGDKDFDIRMMGTVTADLLSVAWQAPSVSNGFAQGLVIKLKKAIAPFGEAVAGTGGDDTLERFAGNNTMDGLAGNDTLISGPGSESLAGGEGNDWVSFAPYSTAVTVNLATGKASSSVTGNDTLSGIENIEGGSGNDNLTGNDGDNSLDGGAGNDVMAGGKGNDDYVVDSASDKVTEKKNEGTDTVRIEAFTPGKAFTLAAEVENLDIQGGFALAVTGNALANTITGNGGANTIGGAGGNDTVTGGGGGDVFVMAMAMGADAVTDFALGKDKLDVKALNLTLAQLLGTLTDDGSGAKFDFGGNGSVRLQGVDGLALDQAAFLNTKVVTVAGITHAEHNDASKLDETVGGDTKADLLIGWDGNDSLGGGDGNDTLAGGFGNDTLDGGKGSDSLFGGDGDDAYTVDAGGDKVVEVADGGTDRVDSSATFALAAFVENLTLTGAANINGTGNELANAITGNDGKNVLDGKAGNDTVAGGDGNDTLLGGDGDDALTGGAGADKLTGGKNADRFVYESAGDSGLQADGTPIDTITDFKSGEDDIDLAAFGLGAITVVAAFSNTGGAEARLAGGILGIDLGGDGVSDFDIAMTGLKSIAESDFIL